ncbi:uncharacterized protein LOC143915630 [Arctopsyche grandis]|uniref:uncharacterized protein LOC143915630 n=1 Tax=Arctopsyche grandis TaxID=121162 RepID=UPI00406D6B3E
MGQYSRRYDIDHSIDTQATQPNMKFVAAFLIVCFAASSYAREYPAGLFPALCPDYPNCDNALLARYYADGQPKPEYLTAVPHSAPLTAFRTEYPAGVPAAACPNYPFCNVGVGSEPLPGFATRQYPAGVPAAACPGYPFC